MKPKTSRCTRAPRLSLQVPQLSQPQPSPARGRIAASASTGCEAVAIPAGPPLQRFRAKRSPLLACALWLFCIAHVATGQVTSLGQSGLLLPEINISPSATGPTSAVKARASVAFNGTVYLVVWQDEREPSSGDVYGARVTPGGQVLDPDGFPISAAPNNQAYPLPRVAACGNTFLVIWNYLPNGSTTEHDVYGCRVDPNGNVQDPNGFLVASGSSQKSYANLASNGINWLVVWRDSRTDTNGDIYGAFVSTNGSLLAPGIFGVCTAPSSQGVSGIASNGKDYFVAWHDYRNGSTRDWDIYGTLVSANGTISSPGGMLIAGAAHAQWFPNVASDGSGFLVTWEDERNEVTFLTDADIYGARIGPSGTLLTPSSIPICLAAGNQLDPSAAFDGTNYFVVWSDDRNNPANVFGVIYGVTADSNGQAASLSAWAFNSDPTIQDHPGIAYGGAGQFLEVHSAINTSNSTYSITGNLIYTQEPSLRITNTKVENAQLTLTWDSVPSLTYEVLSAPQSVGPWTPILTNIVATSFISFRAMPVPTAAQQFFQLVRVR